MRFAPYLQKIDMSFVNKNYTYTEMTLGWSEPALQTVLGSYVEVNYPTGPLPLPLNPVKPFMRFAGLPASPMQGKFNVDFNNGSVLQQTYVDIFCLPCLSRFSILYTPYWNKDFNCQALVATLAWEIEPTLINRVAKYNLGGDMGYVDVSIYDNTYSVSGITPGEVFPMTLCVYAYDGTVLGQMTFNLYAPFLKLIPAQAEVSQLGYSKTMDTSGVTETYNVNHNKTIGQLTQPTQAHAQETRSLGTHLPSMDPATVVSGKANEYVQSFDPNHYNQPFDYSDAKADAEVTAPTATASLNQTHQGNYTLVHGGTLNQTITVDNHTQTITAPQINNTIENYTGVFNGDTFSETAINKYVQIDNERTQINVQSIQAPSYTENTDTLEQIITGTCNVKANNISLRGNTLRFNGTVYQSGGPANLGGGGDGAAPMFYQPRKIPVTAQIYNQDMHFSTKGYAALRQHEGCIYHYYNDPYNCSFGVGSLVHEGPCTAAELKTVVTHDMVDKALNDGVNGNLGIKGPNGGVEAVVKKYVTSFQLTQDQFDALVSFVYNRGESNSRRILTQINQQDFSAATTEMSFVIYGRDKNGKEMVQPGLVARREYETAPFR